MYSFVFDFNLLAVIELNFDHEEPMETQITAIAELPDGRMDAKNAAAFLGLSEKTLAMMRCNGTGPEFIKRGRIWYYKQDLITWVKQASRVRSTAQARAKNRTFQPNNS